MFVGVSDDLVAFKIWATPASLGVFTINEITHLQLIEYFCNVW